MSSHRKRVYFVLMAACVLLLVTAWTVVKDVSLVAAGVMSVVAALLPPVAATVANFGVLSGRRRLDFVEPQTRPRRTSYDGHDDL